MKTHLICLHLHYKKTLAFQIFSPLSVGTHCDFCPWFPLFLSHLNPDSFKFPPSPLSNHVSSTLFALFLPWGRIYIFTFVFGQFFISNFFLVLWCSSCVFYFALLRQWSFSVLFDLRKLPTLITDLSFLLIFSLWALVLFGFGLKPRIGTSFIFLFREWEKIEGHAV